MKSQRKHSMRMRRLFRSLATAATSLGVILTGGAVAQNAIHAAGLDDAALDRAFSEIFGVRSAQAQERTFFAYFDEQISLLGVPPYLPSEVRGALLAAITAYVGAGGTNLPSPIELAEIYPNLPGLAVVYREAIQMAVVTGALNPVVAQLVLAGDLS